MMMTLHQQPVQVRYYSNSCCYCCCGDRDHYFPPDDCRSPLVSGFPPSLVDPRSNSIAVVGERSHPMVLLAVVVAAVGSLQLQQRKKPPVLVSIISMPIVANS